MIGLEACPASFKIFSTVKSNVELDSQSAKSQPFCSESSFYLPSFSILKKEWVSVTSCNVPFPLILLGIFELIGQ